MKHSIGYVSKQAYWSPHPPPPWNLLDRIQFILVPTGKDLDTLPVSTALGLGDCHCMSSRNASDASTALYAPTQWGYNLALVGVIIEKRPNWVPPAPNSICARRSVNDGFPYCTATTLPFLSSV